MFSSTTILEQLKPATVAQTSSPNLDYENLFTYIKKNSFIKAAVDNLHSQNVGVKDLLNAIEDGDASAQVFADPKCYLYLLYLTKNKHINFSQAMTVYGYLIALMQFTNKQPLRPEDKEIRSNQHQSRELTFLILNHGLKFFHPYMPMTKKKLKALQQIVTNKDQADKRSSYIRCRIY